MTATSALARRALAGAVFVALLGSLAAAPALGKQPSEPGPSTGPNGAPPPAAIEAPSDGLADSRLREIHAAWLSGERDFDEVTGGAIRSKSCTRRVPQT